ncbi:MAG: universal stress protein [Candidatus Syntropharchaeia archaeon]
MYRKILVPHDGSIISGKAVKHAASLAKVVGSKITLINVIDIPYISQLSEGFSINIEELERESRSILKSAENAVKDEGVSVSTISVKGRPWEEIVKEAEKGGYDLIIMGSHGKGVIDRMLMGSTAEKVSRHAPCPVTIVR